jgi:hypothetical protein
MKSYDLTDLDMVKAFGGIPTTGARPNQDVKLAFLISAYSRAIGRYCDRQFIGKDPTARRDRHVRPERDVAQVVRLRRERVPLARAVGSARDRLRVARRDALPAYDSTAPQMQSYSPLPKQKTTEDTILGILLPQRERHGQMAQGSFGTVFTGSGYVGQVDVVAKWGIIGVPEDAELATCIAVLDAFRNPEGAAQRAMGDFSMVEAQGGGNIPAAARALLAPMQRS